MEDPFAPHREKLAGARLEIYVSTWCPDCSRLKSVLERFEVPFDTVNISDVDGAAEKLESETGKRGVPYVLVNGSKWVRGYHLDQPGRLNVAVFAHELASAL
jgi:glutaredoxin